MEPTDKDKYIWMLYKYSSSVIVLVLLGLTLYLGLMNSMMSVPFGCLTIMAFTGAIDKVKSKVNQPRT